DRKVKIEDIWIESESESLLRWCAFSEEAPFVIYEKQSQEITLNLQIPLSAKAGSYNYEVRIESAAGKIFRRPQQVRVLSSDRDSQWINEPKFNIYPLTNSTNPKQLKAGKELEVKVKVQNRSRRVDRFYLSPELTPEFSTAWYTIKYPESELDIPGLVKETDGLELNPGKEGEITLILHPPKYTFAGNYCPTIRLISSNREDLVLLDILYLRILPDDRFDAHMYPPSGKIPQEKGEFAIELTNQGNIRRELKVNVKDEEGLFSYSLQPSIVEVLPGVTETVILRANPKKWLQWRRYLKGKGLTFTFDVELENTQEFILPETNKPLALPQTLPQGKILWQSRSWWVLWLLVLLALLGIGGIAFIVWWNFLQGEIPPEPPTIKKFETRNFETGNGEITQDKENGQKKQNEENENVEKINKEYQKGKHKNIPIYWEISNAQKISKVTLIRLEGNIESNRINYLLSDKISQHKEKKNKGKKSFLLGSGSCKFIEDKNKEKNQKQKSDNKLGDKGNIYLLSWSNIFRSITSPFIDKSNANTGVNSNKKVSQRNTLSCNIPSATPEKTGTYTYKLEVFSKQNSEQPSSSQITDTIAIKPATPLPLPKIINLSSTQIVYEEIDPYLLPNSSPVKKTANSLNTAPIRLNWEIITPKHIQELRLIGKTPDGSVNSLEKNYKFINGILPKELEENCKFQKKLDNQGKLICEDFPINDTGKAGEYIFTLTVIPKTTETQKESDDDKAVISKQTDTIKVKPLPLPQITEFSPVKAIYQEVNAATKNNEKSQQINTSEPPILLNWQIKNPNQIKELRLIGTNNGSLSESKTYLMNGQGIPIKLKDKCYKQENILGCRNISTEANKPGNYTFKIVLIPKKGEAAQEIIKTTEAIKIESQPTPIKIINFKINGKDVKNNPKQTFVLNKKRSDASINVSWKVEDGKDIKVEILPAPGVVGHKDSITQYKLSKPPSSETITLKVTNKAGEEKTQSVIIQTVESTLPKQRKSSTTINNPGTSNTSTGSDRKNAKSSNKPAPPELSPLELPPQFN
nr:hypothetical protein [Mastigocoleus sp. MO_167.B18]